MGKGLLSNPVAMHNRCPMPSQYPCIEGDILILPFGKYRSEQVDIVFEDNPQYLYWLIDQPWLKEKYKTLYLNIIKTLEVTEEVELSRGVEMVVDRVMEALLARGFSTGEAEQMVNRLIQFTGKKGK